METRGVRPGELDRLDIAGENALILGAPHIGKSFTLKNREGIEVASSLEDALAAAPEQPVALDDFYDTWVQAPDTNQSRFPELLSRPGGVLISTRPRSLDWLLDHNEHLTAEFLDALNTCYHLEFDPEQDWDAATQLAKTLTTDFPPSEVEEYLPELQFPAYEFTNQELRERFSAFGPTLLPPLAARLTPDIASNAIELSTGTASGLVRDFAANIGVSEAVGKLKSIVPDVFSEVPALGLSSLGAGAALSPPALFAGGLVLWLVARRGSTDGLSSDNVFNALLEKDLYPHTKAQLEDWLSLPPRTLENLQNIAPDLTDDVIDDIQSTLKDHEVRLDELEAELERFDEQFAALSKSYHGFTKIDRASLAVQSPKSFEQSLRTGFRPFEAAEGLVLDREYLPDDGEGRVSVTAELIENATDGRDQLLLGPAGSGKSSISSMVAATWVTEERGPVFYRRSGKSRFEKPELFATDITEATQDGTVLVVVEDGVRDETRDIYRVLKQFRDDPNVVFLIDARRGEDQEFRPAKDEGAESAAINDAYHSLESYSVPALDTTECRRMITHFEQHTDSTITTSATALFKRLDADSGRAGEMLQLSHLLFHSDDSSLGLVNDVRTKFDVIERPEPGQHQRASQLAERDPHIRRHVALLIQLLNTLPETGIERAYFETGLAAVDGFSEDEIRSVISDFQGWFIFVEQGQLRTMHEYWSFLYLRYMLRGDEREPRARRRPPLDNILLGWEDVTSEAHSRLATCLEAIFNTLEKQQRAAGQQSSSNPLIQDVEPLLDAEPDAEANRIVKALFQLGNDHPVLAELFYPGDELQIDFRIGTLCAPGTVAEGLIRVGRMHRKQVRPNTANQALEAAQQYAHQIEDPERYYRVQALHMIQLSGLARFQEEDQRAIDAGSRAVKLAEKSGDQTTVIRALNYYSAVLREAHFDDDAHQVAQRAVELAERIDDPGLKAESLNNLGAATADSEAALQRYERALDNAQRAGNRKEEASALFWIGLRAERQLDDPEKAVEYLQQARVLYDEIGDNERLGWCLTHLSSLVNNNPELTVGDDPLALLDRAEEIFQSIDMDGGLRDVERRRATLTEAE